MAASPPILRAGFFEFWRVEFRSLIIFLEDFAWESLIISDDNTANIFTQNINAKFTYSAKIARKNSAKNAWRARSARGIFVDESFFLLFSMKMLILR